MTRCAPDLRLLILAVPLAACSALAPESFADGTPEMRPETFFLGATVSSGVQEDRGGAPTRRFHVAGSGTVLADGDLRLDQTIDFDGDPPRERSWVLHRIDAHRYSASLTDATGPVRAEAYGNLFHLRYAMQSPFGGEMEQWLYLQPDGSTVMNEATVSVFGVVAARLSERISRAAP